MTEPTKIINVGELTVSVDDLSKDTRELVRFYDRINADYAELEEELRDTSERLTYKLNVLLVARQAAFSQLQQTLLDELQQQATAAPSEDAPENAEASTEEVEENAE